MHTRKPFHLLSEFKRAENRTLCTSQFVVSTPSLYASSGLERPWRIRRKSDFSFIVSATNSQWAHTHKKSHNRKLRPATRAQQREAIGLIGKEKAEIRWHPHKNRKYSGWAMKETRRGGATEGVEKEIRARRELLSVQEARRLTKRSRQEVSTNLQPPHPRFYRGLFGAFPAMSSRSPGAQIKTRLHG